MLDFVNFIKHVRGEISGENENSAKSPIIVHCSDGAAKTGLFIAIDKILNNLQNESFIDILGLVYKLKLSRQVLISSEVSLYDRWFRTFRMIFGQKFKFSSKIDIFFKNRKIDQKSKLFSKIEFLLEKSKLSSKLENSNEKIKNPKFGQKSKIWLKI